MSNELPVRTSSTLPSFGQQWSATPPTTDPAGAPEGHHWAWSVARVGRPDGSLSAGQMYCSCGATRDVPEVLPPDSPLRSPRTVAGTALLMAGLTFHSGRRLADHAELIVAIEEQAVALQRAEGPKPDR